MAAMEIASFRIRQWSFSRFRSKTSPHQTQRRLAVSCRPLHRPLLLLVGQHHSQFGCVYKMVRTVSSNVLADGKAGANSNRDDKPTNDTDEEDKWTQAIHPFQEPHWTGRKDPAEYLAYMQNVTLPQLRRRRRQRDLVLLRQAEQVVWQVELMHRAYQDFVEAENANQNTTAAENQVHDNSPASTNTIAPPVVSSAAALQRYNDCRQEALEERLEFIRLRRIHVRGKNHYKFAMQNFPIPEPLSDADPHNR